MCSSLCFKQSKEYECRSISFNVNKIRFLVQHKSYECKYRLNENECNSKYKWNLNECRYECKELDDWGSCESDYIWNPIMCDCECNDHTKLTNT